MRPARAGAQGAQAVCAGSKLCANISLAPKDYACLRKHCVCQTTEHVGGCLPGGAGEWWTTPDGKSKRYLQSPSTLKAMLEAAGFRNVEIQVSSAPCLFSWCPLLGCARFPILRYTQGVSRRLRSSTRVGVAEGYRVYCTVYV